MARKVVVISRGKQVKQGAVELKAGGEKRISKGKKNSDKHCGDERNDGIRYLKYIFLPADY